MGSVTSTATAGRRAGLAAEDRERSAGRRRAGAAEQDASGEAGRPEGGGAASAEPGRTAKPSLDLPQPRGHFGGARRPALRILLQELADEGRERRRKLGVEIRDGGGGSPITFAASRRGCRPGTAVGPCRSRRAARRARRGRSARRVRGPGLLGRHGSQGAGHDPSAVSESSSLGGRRLATPKSRILACPDGVTITFCVFRSRWIRPTPWAAARPSATCRAMAMAWRTAGGRGARLGERLALDVLHDDRFAGALARGCRRPGRSRGG